MALWTCRRYLQRSVQAKNQTHNTHTHSTTRDSSVIYHHIKTLWIIITVNRPFHTCRPSWAPRQCDWQVLSCSSAPAHVPSVNMNTVNAGRKHSVNYLRSMTIPTSDDPGGEWKSQAYRDGIHPLEIRDKNPGGGLETKPPNGGMSPPRSWTTFSDYNDRQNYNIYFKNFRVKGGGRNLLFRRNILTGYMPTTTIA